MVIISGVPIFRIFTVHHFHTSELPLNILIIGKGRSEQIVLTQIRLLLSEQSDHGLTRLPFPFALKGESFP